jgi:alpha-L-fucosidase
MTRRTLSRRRLLETAAAVAPVAAGLAAPAHAQRADTSRDYLSEARAARDARMKWWRDARFGMFIHWGLYAVPAGTYQGRQINGIGEWIMASANIPREEYEKFAPQFNPVRFNAREWVRIAKGAGMKYLVITSKHHDGFALWDSKVSDWDVVDSTPFKGDILKELSAECRRQGLKFCTYHSILDWHHPAQMPNPRGKDPHNALASNAMKEGRKAEYVAYLKGQLKEIVDNYDPAVLWFDGEWVEWWTEQDGKDLYRWLRAMRPNMVINNRIGKGRKGMEGLSKDASYAGDFGTPEQEIPRTGLPGVDWESCMTMNDTWGYKSFDQNWKSATDLIRKLVDITSKGGNFLLNVGPTAEGLIPAPSVERLAEMGRWTALYGESVYGAHASPFPNAIPWGRVSSRPGRLYLHVFDWPSDGRLVLTGLESPAGRAYSLADRGRKPLPVAQSGSEVTITVPAAAPNPHASVIVLETRGDLKIVGRP